MIHFDFKMVGGRWRSTKYLGWVRELPCSHCGGDGGEAHHLKGVGHLSGTSTKAPDWAVMPMCHYCHGELHERPHVWTHQWEHIVLTLGLAIQTGVLVVKDGKLEAA